MSGGDRDPAPAGPRRPGVSKIFPVNFSHLPPNRVPTIYSLRPLRWRDYDHEMSRLIQALDSVSISTDSPIGFATQGSESLPVWDRFITLDGKKAHYLGNVCGTCEFIFERHEGANSKVSPESLSGLFRSGISDINDAIKDAVMALLPAGDYKMLLLSCVPRLITPSKAGDYFFEEQVELWGIDPFWGVPHYTKNEYYRTEVLKVPEHGGLFEFIVPMFPGRYLDTKTIESYKASLSRRPSPTAFAISVLDVKQPAEWDGNPEIHEHWCLAHYLLDGHHKMYAAAQYGKPISLLSCLAIKKGVSGPNEIAKVISILEKA